MRFIFVIGTVVLFAMHPADAQIGQLPGNPLVLPPPPPAPPPPPKIEVPVVPKMDAPLSPPAANLQPRGSFSDRAARCLEEGAARGLGPNDRSGYVSGCVNR
jgi:hypothetical protein